MPGIWSRHRDEITIDRLHKFWSELPIQARHDLLRIDKQSLFEQARKNLYCSRCNGLLLESFTQIVAYGKSVNHQPEGNFVNSLGRDESDQGQDPSVHPWGGLAATKDGLLTLLDCFINARSLKPLQNVFDSARGREREREMLYPDACGGEGRGWISQGGTGGSAGGYGGRAHATRETCALHTARLSCDTLMDFWSALGDETRSSLLQMKEEDFIERLMYRFDSKRFCRDCRRNVIREFKELKELKRMRRELRCTTWFCGPDTAFQYEVSEHTVEADWNESFGDGKYHHFEWAVGTAEGKYDILDFEDVGTTGRAQLTGLDLAGVSSCFIALRAWRLDGRCTEICVRAYALHGHLCVHKRIIVGDGFVSITKGEGMREFFEHAEEAEEEDEEDAMEREGNDMDGEGSHPQKHAKSPELAREFLLDAATVIFKEQVEKAFREGTARQNAHSVFVSLALKFLEERVHVACKEIITLEKQTKLLEEEEREKREEEERKERRRNKEREKKLRRKERLRGKETREKEIETELETNPPELKSESKSQSPETPDLREDSACDISEITPHATEIINITEAEETECNGSVFVEQSKSTRRKLKFSTEPGNHNNNNNMNNNNTNNNSSRERNMKKNCRSRDRYGNEYHSCGCGDRQVDRYGTEYHSYKPKLPFYRGSKYNNNSNNYVQENNNFATVLKGGSNNNTGTLPKKDPSSKQVWEPRNNIDSGKTELSGKDVINCKSLLKREHGSGERENLGNGSNSCNGYNHSHNGSIGNGGELDNCSSSGLSESSEPHNESSSSTSDSEQSDGRDNNIINNENSDSFQKDQERENAKENNNSPSPLENGNGDSCSVPSVASQQVREGVAKSTIQMGVTVLPAHTPTVHGPTYSSNSLGFHKRAVPLSPTPPPFVGPTASGLFHYGYPNHHHLGFGGVPIHYSVPVVHPYVPSTPVFSSAQQRPVYKQCVSRQVVGPAPASPFLHASPNPEKLAKSEATCISQQVNNDNNRQSGSGGAHQNLSRSQGEEESSRSHFSLFHFGGPMASRDQGGSKEERNGGLQCSKEETDVREYNLFSSRSTFSFF